MKIAILGAAGQIARLLAARLLNETDADLVLYARRAGDRIKPVDSTRQEIVGGDFKDGQQLRKALKDADVVYINDMGDAAATQAIVEAMKECGVKKAIAASILGIYDEVPGPFGRWNERMVGKGRIRQQAESAAVLEDSDRDYTLLRLTWLYNQNGNIDYELTDKGQPFIGAQVTRQAVTQLIIDIIQDKSGRFSRASVGVSEPNTDWDKPSFY